MQVIPVIDLKQGQVVHARHGNRHQYRPIVSTLTASCTLEAVIDAFLRLHPFSIFYIADLDAITGAETHHAIMIESLLKNRPELEFWVDSGKQLDGLTANQPGHYKPVIGTESQPHAIAPGPCDYVLSLDFKNGQRLGHESWFDKAEAWPQNIIVMNLNRVGAEQGPDFDKISSLQKNHPAKSFVAAGGVRDAGDLQQLAAQGIQFALLATALHNGTISQTDLQNLQTKKYPG